MTNRRSVNTQASKSPEAGPRFEATCVFDPLHLIRAADEPETLEQEKVSAQQAAKLEAQCRADGCTPWRVSLAHLRVQAGSTVSGPLCTRRAYTRPKDLWLPVSPVNLKKAADFNTFR